MYLKIFRKCKDNNCLYFNDIKKSKMTVTSWWDVFKMTLTCIICWYRNKFYSHNVLRLFNKRFKKIFFYYFKRFLFIPCALICYWNSLIIFFCNKVLRIFVLLLILTESWYVSFCFHLLFLKINFKNKNADHI